MDFGRWVERELTVFAHGVQQHTALLLLKPRMLIRLHRLRNPIRLRRNYLSGILFGPFYCWGSHRHWCRGIRRRERREARQTRQTRRRVRSAVQPLHDLLDLLDGELGELVLGHEAAEEL